MLKRVVLSACCAASLGVAASVLTVAEAEVVAFGPSTCRVSNTTHAYDYGNPPTYRGWRQNSDSWRHYMNQYDCTVNLSQVRVKQWGAEVCALYNAGYVVLNWQWQYYDDDLNMSYGNLSQQYDCNDLP